VVTHEGGSRSSRSARDYGRTLLAQRAVACGSLADAMADGAIGLFCGIGICFECESPIAGKVERACLVRPGHD
jgi:hypothetical protein